MPPHIRHPESSPTSPRALCEMPVDLEVLGNKGSSMSAALVEWDWVKSQESPPVCHRCLAVKRRATTK